jgi:signal transduction histidine kinase
LLRHIFNNLLSNAVKYSPAGSTVDLIVQREAQDALFTVRDQGAGIPTEDQARLFQPFERGRNVSGTPGTGLGLVIVQRCVSLHGGTMRLTSAPGQGTTVMVRLPIFLEKDSDTALVRRWTTPATGTPDGES